MKRLSFKKNDYSKIIWWINLYIIWFINFFIHSLIFLYVSFYLCVIIYLFYSCIMVMYSFLFFYLLIHLFIYFSIHLYIYIASHLFKGSYEKSLNQYNIWIFFFIYYDLIGQALCMFCRWMGAILNYMTSVANTTRIPFVLRETIHRFVSFHMLSFNVGMYPEARIFPDSYGSRIMRTKSGYSSRLNTLRCVPTGWFQKNFLNSKCILVVTASHRLRGKYCQFPAVLPPMIYGSLMTRPMLARFHYRQILLIFYQE